jgi:hypothetical protein
MKDKTSVIVGSATLGLLAGFGVITGAVNLKTVAIAGMLALPTTFVTHLISDTQATKRINQSEERVKGLERELQKALSKTTFLEDVEARSLHLTEEVNKVRAALQLALGEHQKASELNQYLQQTLTTLETDLEASKGRVEELQAECEEWELQFSDRVLTESEAKFQQAKKVEIERIFQEHDAITSQAIVLFQRLQGWGEKVAHGHQTKREIIKNLATSYNANLDELGELVEKERGHYIEQIELLHEKVGRLQHQINGDLVEPEYGQFGFDQNGRIANAIAEWLWNHHKIPLKVTGFEVSPDGTLTAGYIYPRSMPVEALSKQIEGDSSTIARSLGLYALEKPTKLQIADVFTVRVRRDRPARKADKGSLYRSKEEFIKYILSQPVRLRIVGEPGSGKTPTVAVLLGHLLSRGFLEANTPNGRKLPYCVVESCNPLAGISVKNGDELDFCLKWNSGATGFKGLAQEYRFRKNPANAEYKNQVGYIWVADEIDVTMADLTKDEAKPFKDALKDGGHINLGVIVMGQSANVSTSKGLSIDDQKMLTNIYIDAVSIRTFLTQYGERFYSKRAVEKALSTLEELELEIEEKNEVICDTAREFRIAMVTANRSPVFYQLPYFDSVDIDVFAYQETLARVSAIRDGRVKTGVVDGVSPDSGNVDIAAGSERLAVSGRSSYAGLGTRPDTPVKPICPHCGSHSIRSKGSKWLCQNPEHSSVAPAQPKSWNK